MAENPRDVRSEAPPEQPLRESATDNFAPVLRVTKKETALAKGDKKLQRVTVTEDVSRTVVVDTPAHSVVNPAFSWVYDSVPGPPHPVRVEETSPVEDQDKVTQKEKKLKILSMNSKKKDIVPKKEDKKKNSLEQLPPKKPPRKLKEEKKDIKIKDVKHNNNEPMSPHEQEFEKIYEQITHDKTPMVIDENILEEVALNAEELQASFDEIVHAYQEDQQGPTTLDNEKTPSLKNNGSVITSNPANESEENSKENEQLMAKPSEELTIKHDIKNKNLTSIIDKKHEVIRSVEKKKRDNIEKSKESSIYDKEKKQQQTEKLKHKNPDSENNIKEGKEEKNKKLIDTNKIHKKEHTEESKPIKEKNILKEQKDTPQPLPRKKHGETLKKHAKEDLCNENLHQQKEKESIAEAYPVKRLENKVVLKDEIKPSKTGDLKNPNKTIKKENTEVSNSIGKPLEIKTPKKIHDEENVSSSKDKRNSLKVVKEAIKSLLPKSSPSDKSSDSDIKLAHEELENKPKSQDDCHVKNTLIHEYAQTSADKSKAKKKKTHANKHEIGEVLDKTYPDTYSQSNDADKNKHTIKETFKQTPQIHIVSHEKTHEKMSDVIPKQEIRYSNKNNTGETENQNAKENQSASIGIIEQRSEIPIDYQNQTHITRKEPEFPSVIHENKMNIISNQNVEIVKQHNINENEKPTLNDPKALKETKQIHIAKHSPEKRVNIDIAQNNDQILRPILPIECFAEGTQKVSAAILAENPEKEVDPENYKYENQDKRNSQILPDIKENPRMIQNNTLPKTQIENSKNVEVEANIGVKQNLPPTKDLNKTTIQTSDQLPQKPIDSPHIPNKHLENNKNDENVRMIKITSVDNNPVIDKMNDNETIKTLKDKSNNVLNTEDKNEINNPNKFGHNTPEVTAEIHNTTDIKTKPQKEHEKQHEPVDKNSPLKKVTETVKSLLPRPVNKPNNVDPKVLLVDPAKEHLNVPTSVTQKNKHDESPHNKDNTVLRNDDAEDKMKNKSPISHGDAEIREKITSKILDYQNEKNNDQSKQIVVDHPKSLPHIKNQPQIPHIAHENKANIFPKIKIENLKKDKTPPKDDVTENLPLEQEPKKNNIKISEQPHQKPNYSSYVRTENFENNKDDNELHKPVDINSKTQNINKIQHENVDKNKPHHKPKETVEKILPNDKSTNVVSNDAHSEKALIDPPRGHLNILTSVTEKQPDTCGKPTQNVNSTVKNTDQKINPSYSLDVAEIPVKIPANVVDFQNIENKDQTNQIIVDHPKSLPDIKKQPQIPDIAHEKKDNLIPKTKIENLKNDKTPSKVSEYLPPEQEPKKVTIEKYDQLPQKTIHPSHARNEHFQNNNVNEKNMSAEKVMSVDNKPMTEPNETDVIQTLKEKNINVPNTEETKENQEHYKNGLHTPEITAEIHKPIDMRTKPLKEDEKEHEPVDKIRPPKKVTEIIKSLLPRPMDKSKNVDRKDLLVHPANEPLNVPTSVTQKNIHVSPQNKDNTVISNVDEVTKLEINSPTSRDAAETPVNISSKVIDSVNEKNNDQSKQIQEPKTFLDIRKEPRNSDIPHEKKANIIPETKIENLKQDEITPKVTSHENLPSGQEPNKNTIKISEQPHQKPIDLSHVRREHVENNSKDEKKSATKIISVEKKPEIKLKETEIVKTQKDKSTKIPHAEITEENQHYNKVDHIKTNITTEMHKPVDINSKPQNENEKEHQLVDKKGPLKKAKDIVRSLLPRPIDKSKDLDPKVELVDSANEHIPTDVNQEQTYMYEESPQNKDNTVKYNDENQDKQKISTSTSDDAVEIPVKIPAKIIECQNQKNNDQSKQITVDHPTSLPDKKQKPLIPDIGLEKKANIAPKKEEENKKKHETEPKIGLKENVPPEKRPQKIKTSEELAQKPKDSSHVRNEHFENINKDENMSPIEVVSVKYKSVTNDIPNTEVTNENQHDRNAGHISSKITAEINRPINMPAKPQKENEKHEPVDKNRPLTKKTTKSLLPRATDKFKNVEPTDILNRDLVDEKDHKSMPMPDLAIADDVKQDNTNKTTTTTSKECHLNMAGPGNNKKEKHTTKSDTVTPADTQVPGKSYEHNLINVMDTEPKLKKYLFDDNFVSTPPQYASLEKQDKKEIPTKLDTDSKNQNNLSQNLHEADQIPVNIIKNNTNKPEKIIHSYQKGPQHITNRHENSDQTEVGKHSSNQTEGQIKTVQETKPHEVTSPEMTHSLEKTLKPILKKRDTGVNSIERDLGKETPKPTPTNLECSDHKVNVQKEQPTLKVTREGLKRSVSFEEGIEERDVESLNSAGKPQAAFSTKEHKPKDAAMTVADKTESVFYTNELPKKQSVQLRIAVFEKKATDTLHRHPPSSPMPVNKEAKQLHQRPSNEKKEVIKENTLVTTKPPVTKPLFKTPYIDDTPKSEPVGKAKSSIGGKIKKNIFKLMDDLMRQKPKDDVKVDLDKPKNAPEITEVIVVADERKVQNKQMVEAPMVVKRLQTQELPKQQSVMSKIALFEQRSSSPEYNIAPKPTPCKPTVTVRRDNHVIHENVPTNSFIRKKSEGADDEILSKNFVRNDLILKGESPSKSPERGNFKADIALSSKADGDRVSKFEKSKHYVSLEKDLELGDNALEIHNEERMRPDKKVRSVLEKIAMFESNDMKPHGLKPNQKPESVKPAVCHSPLDGALADVLLATAIGSLEEARGEYGTEKVPRISLADGSTMPEVALNTATLHPRLAKAVVRAAIDLGCRAVDTAPDCGNERPVGEAVREKIAEGVVTRSDLYVISRLCGTRSDLAASCDSSLRAMGLDYFDLCLVQSPVALKGAPDQAPGPSGSAWAALRRLLATRRVRSLAVGSVQQQHAACSSEQVERLARGGGQPAVSQIECHPVGHQRQLMDLCRQRGVQVSSGDADQTSGPGAAPETLLIRMGYTSKN